MKRPRFKKVEIELITKKTVESEYEKKLGVTSVTSLHVRYSNYANKS